MTLCVGQMYGKKASGFVLPRTPARGFSAGRRGKNAKKWKLFNYMYHNEIQYVVAVVQIIPVARRNVNKFLTNSSLYEPTGPSRRSLNNPSPARSYIPRAPWKTDRKYDRGAARSKRRAATRTRTTWDRVKTTTREKKYP